MFCWASDDDYLHLDCFKGIPDVMVVPAVLVKDHRL